MSAALADNTVDPDIGASDVSVYEVDQIAAISCVHMATASLTAGRAFLPLHAETSVVVFKYLDILRRMFIPSCKAPERVDAVASASEGNEAGGKTDK